MPDDRNGRVEREVAALWSETFGEQPAIAAEAATMLEILVDCLEDVGPFRLDQPCVRRPGAPSESTGDRR